MLHVVLLQVPDSVVIKTVSGGYLMLIVRLARVESVLEYIIHSSSNPDRFRIGIISKETLVILSKEGNKIKLIKQTK